MKTNKTFLALLCSFFLVIIISCDDKENIIDTKPVAAFTVSITDIIPNTTLEFKDASFDQNGQIVSWLWDFGNGQTSTEKSPAYTFTSEGIFIVKLKVIDNSGNENVNVFSKTISVSTSNISPDIIWSYTLPGKVEDSSPAVSDNGVVYIGCTANGVNKNVFAISNGNLVWSYATGDIVRSAPAIHPNGNIYIGSYDNKLYGFSPTGTVVMQYNMGDNAKYSGPVFGLNGEIYIGSQSNKLHAVSTTGTELWAYNTGDDVNATPAVGADGKIYFGSINDRFYCLNPNGSLNWSSIYGSWTSTATAIGPDGTIYFAGEGNNINPTFGGVLLAYNTNGTERWRVNLTEKVNQGGPAIAQNGTVYVGGHSNELLAFSSNGTLLWAYPTNGNILSTPAIDNDGNIYFGDDAGYFYVVNPQGTKKWKDTQLGDKIWNSPTIGNDGKIYIAADQIDGTSKLYALRTNATGLATGGWPMRSKNAKHTGN